MKYNSFDEVDRQILKILQEDGKISMKKLGEAVFMSAPAVAERVKRLEDSGVIDGYTIRVNPAAMGFQVHATLVIMLAHGKKGAFLKYIQEEPDIIVADELPGKTDAILEVHCVDIIQFYGLISRIREYAATDSYIHMSHYKRIPVLPPSVSE